MYLSVESFFYLCVCVYIFFSSSSRLLFNSVDEYLNPRHYPILSFEPFTARDQYSLLCDKWRHLRSFGTQLPTIYLRWIVKNSFTLGWVGEREEEKKKKKTPHEEKPFYHDLDFHQAPPLAQSIYVGVHHFVSSGKCSTHRKNPLSFPAGVVRKTGGGRKRLFVIYNSERNLCHSCENTSQQEHVPLCIHTYMHTYVGRRLGNFSFAWCVLILSRFRPHRFCLVLKYNIRNVWATRWRFSKWWFVMFSVLWWRFSCGPFFRRTPYNQFSRVTRLLKL